MNDKSASGDRKGRLGAALRANLRRRKQPGSKAGQGKNPHALARRADPLAPPSARPAGGDGPGKRGGDDGA